MRKFLCLTTLLLLLTGCRALAPTATPATASSSTSSARSKRAATPAKRKAKPDTTADVDDLIGHYFVNVADHDEVLQFSADTSGYIFDVQRRDADNGEFLTAAAGIFNAELTTSGSTYTLSGTAQPHAAASTVQFEKLSATKLRQLPDGPTYRRVRNDDRTTIK